MYEPKHRDENKIELNGTEAPGAPLAEQWLRIYKNKKKEQELVGTAQ